MFYYRTDSDDRRGRVIGGVAGACYVLFWVLLMVFWNFSFAEPDTGGGILIDFGDSETGSGLVDPAVNDITNPDVPEFSAPDFAEDDIATQDFEEAPEVVQPDRSNNNSQQPQNQRTDSERPPQEQPRTVNQQALFPGRTENSTSQSEGTSPTGPGNQGSPDGSPQGDHDGTGGGGSGTGFDLAGRSVIGSLPAPAYGSNKQGRVIVEITVNAAGEVVNAAYRGAGSQTNDAELVAAALRAARQSRFNKIEGDGLQTGTITYNFRLK
ncbi:MAG: TonB family protein [Alistipes sp.]|nr:TonB family protein [Alistipes sp.]